MKKLVQILKVNFKFSKAFPLEIGGEIRKVADSCFFVHFGRFLCCSIGQHRQVIELKILNVLNNFSLKFKFYNRLFSVH